VRDNDLPTFILDNTNGPATTGDSFEIKADFADNVGVGKAKIIYTFDGITFYNETLSSINGVSWNRTILMASNATYIEYYFYFEDKEGNHNNTISRRISINDNDAPTLLKDNSLPHPTTGDEFTFSANFTDNIEFLSARVLFSFDSINFYNISMRSLLNYTWYVSVIIDTDVHNLYYYFYFEDIRGNHNSSSVRIMEIHDNDQPVFLMDLSSNRTVTGDNHTFSVNVTDNINVSTVVVYYNFNNNFFHNLSLTRVNNNTWEGTINVNINASSIHYFYVFQDNSSNSNETSISTVEVFDSIRPIFIADKTLTMPTTGEKFIFSVCLGDNIGIASVVVDYSFDGYNCSHLILNSTVGDTWDGTINIPSNSIKIEYYFQLEDYDGNVNWSSVTVLPVLDNDKPLPEAGDDFIVKTGEVAIFDGTKSQDNVGISNYTWSFEHGDSKVLLYGRIQTFVFDIASNYSIMLTVMDDYGNQANDTLRIKVIFNDTQDDDDMDDDTDDDIDDDDDDTDDDISDDDDTSKQDSDSRSQLTSWITIPLIMVALIIVILILIMVFRRRRKEEPSSKEENIPEETLMPEKVDTPKEIPTEVTMDLIDPPPPSIDNSLETVTSDLPPICSTCGSFSEFYPEYNCYWCENCQDYIHTEEVEGGLEMKNVEPPEDETLPPPSEDIPPLSSAESKETAVILADEMGTIGDKDPIIEELNKTREMLEKAPSFIDITQPLEILEQAKLEIENDEFEKASNSIRQSKDLAQEIRERYKELVNKSDAMLKEVQELKHLDLDADNIIALLAAGKKELMIGDFSQCGEYFEKASKSIEDTKKGTVEESSTPARNDQTIEQKNEEKHIEKPTLKEPDTSTVQKDIESRPDKDEQAVLGRSEFPLSEEEPKKEVSEECSEKTGDDEIKNEVGNENVDDMPSSLEDLLDDMDSLFD
ncbi:MAG: PKD domain-containing protein, partial [Candidatus Thermoplasmatota archaeon]|nr:PKD domain-containing protein [Candidatus Thermoplasmatota archaeon]